MRGITYEDPELQTYALFIPVKIMKKYQQEYLNEIKSKIASQQNKITGDQNVAVSAFKRTPAIPAHMDLQESTQMKNRINKIMIKTIEQVRAEPLKIIRERSFYDRFTNRIPITDQSAHPVMYKDKWMSFSRYFLMGMDFDLLMFDALNIVFILMTSKFNTGMDVKSLMAVLVAYIANYLVV